ncbi:MAG: hypothetical protein LBI67_05545 [Treponema sp.]|jgi:hypothetical protein|nr:hypothetical protein [Treponema sp.]
MNKEEKEPLEKYRRLTPENRANALSNLRVALAAQENTRKAMNVAPSPNPGKRSA